MGVCYKLKEYINMAVKEICDSDSAIERFEFFIKEEWVYKGVNREGVNEYN